MEKEDVTLGKFIEFIENCFGDATLTGTGPTLHANVICPKCLFQYGSGYKKRKLAIRVNDHLVKCWVCDYRSTNLSNLLATYHPFFLQEYKKKFKIRDRSQRCIFIDQFRLLAEGKKEAPKELTPSLTLPRGFKLLAANGKDWRAKKAIDYLRRRGLDEADLWRWKMGITTEAPTEKGEQDYRFRVIVPSFDVNGKLNFFSARAFLPDWKGAPYSNPTMKREELVFNELNIDWTKELTLVEGVFDLMKCNDNASCILGSSFDPSYKLFQEIVTHQTPVLLALDPDARNKALKIAKALLEYGVTVRFLELPPGIKDVGELQKGEFTQHAERAKLMTMEDFFQMKLRE